ncbi:putative RNA binding protein [Pelagophyceae sp. CCMP2097]|nr:putative RNA binding protein [Pelagophyceae sp. CCMP2097]
MFAQCSPGESVRGRVAQLCRDQHGSRYLQAHLDGHLDEPAELEIIFEEVLAKARELTTDVFGNYVVQKVLATGDATVRARVAEALKGQAVALSLHVYGCRVIQKALEALPAAQAIEVIKEFQGNVLLCVHDVNGQARRNHVIQKCVEVTSNARKAHDAGDVGLLGDQIDFVLAAFVGQARSLAVHPYGCRVLQRVLEHCARAQTARLLGELRGGDLRALIEDQYANYVMQHAIQFGRPEDRALLVAAVRASLADFSRHKFASNVVEKCLEFGSEEERRDLIDEIVADRGGDDGQESSMLRLLITDPFANYVVQKVVDLADEAQVAAIAARLRPVAQHVRHTPGKHILSRLEKKVAIKF